MSAQLQRRWRSEAGMTLVELVVVMLILTIVLLGLTTSFVSGMRSEVAVSQRQQAQQNARTALERMREDVHCANGVAGVNPNDTDAPGSGFTLTLTETNGVCPSVISDPDAPSTVAIQWCTIPDAAHPGLFGLYRQEGTCDGSDPSLFVAYVTAPGGGWPTNSTTTATDWSGNVWPDARSCSANRAPTLAVDLAVNPDLANHPGQTYELKDEIALRNAPPCS